MIHFDNLMETKTLFSPFLYDLHVESAWSVERRGVQNVNITFTPDYKFTQIIQLPAEVGRAGGAEPLPNNKPIKLFSLKYESGGK